MSSKVVVLLEIGRDTESLDPQDPAYAMWFTRDKTSLVLDGDSLTVFDEDDSFYVFELPIGRVIEADKLLEAMRVLQEASDMNEAELEVSHDEVVFSLCDLFDIKPAPHYTHIVVIHDPLNGDRAMFPMSDRQYQDFRYTRRELWFARNRHLETDELPEGEFEIVHVKLREYFTLSVVEQYAEHPAYTGEDNVVYSTIINRDEFIALCKDAEMHSQRAGYNANDLDQDLLDEIMTTHAPLTEQDDNWLATRKYPVVRVFKPLE